MGLEIFVFLTLLNLNGKIACVINFEVIVFDYFEGNAGFLLKFVV